MYVNNDIKFILKPFSTEWLPAEIGISGSIRRSTGTFGFRCEVQGVSAIAVPAPAETPDRRDRLWEETCFELFIAPETSDYYWEFNLSPSGHWNVYRFTSYRREMKEEKAFASLAFSVEARPDVLTLFLETDLGPIIPIDRTISVGISTVVKMADGTLTYWALTHPGPRPDFHRRDGFVLELRGL